MHSRKRSQAATATLALVTAVGLCGPALASSAGTGTGRNSSASVRVTTTPLPGLPGASGPTKAYALNNSGTVVGSATTAGSVMHAVVWSGPTVTDLDPAGTAPSAALDVNDSGQIVGRTGLNFHNNAVLWQNGQAYALPSPPDPSPSDFIYGCTAPSINNAGLVGGFCDVDINSSVVGLPVIWRDRQPVVLWSRGEVLAVSARGHLAGRVEHGYNGEGLRAVLQDGSGLHELPSLVPGVDGDQAFSVNRADLVVGQSAGRPVRWQAGKVRALPAPSRAGAAYGVNAWGSIVGTEGVTSRPVMWKAGVLIPLGSVSGAAMAVTDNGLAAGWVGRDTSTSRAVKWRITGGSQG